MKASFEKIASDTLASFRTLRVAAPVFDHVYHFHPEIEVTLIESGHGQRFIGDSIEPFASGDLVVIGPNLPHCYLTDPQESRGSDWARASVIQFDCQAFGEGFFELPELSRIKALLNRSERGVQFVGGRVDALRERIVELSQAKDSDRIVGLVGLLAELSGLRGRSLSSPEFRPELRVESMDRIERVVALVRKDFRDPIPLAKAAKTASMTPPAFSRFFHRVTGRTFTRFVNEVRIGQACRQLSTTDKPISEIAFSCGFGTLSNFSQRFNELRGQSPRSFRNATRGQG